jgi:NADH-quinone oxidoreductase subunit C
VASSPGPLPPAEVLRRLRAQFGEDLLDAEDGHGEAVVKVAPGRYRELVQMLRDDPDLGFDFLDFVSAVDRKEEGLEVVVQLYSTQRRHRARVKVACDAEEPRVPSLHDLYPGANWHERETWELFGIDFEGHPQLVKLLLPEPFEGYPLRKDFVLMSRMAKPWPGEEKAEGEGEE